MKNRLSIAILVACMLPLGTSIGAEQHGALGVTLRIGNPGDAPAKLAGYDLSVRHALLDSGAPRNIALAAIAPRSSPEAAGLLDDQMFHAASRVSGFSDLDPLAIEADRKDWRALDDEYEILKRAMHRAGLPAAAPIGWVPSEGDAIARAGAG